MTKVQVKDNIQDFVWHSKLVLKVLVWQALVILVACGVLYITNFKFQITKVTHTISPIVETETL